MVSTSSWFGIGLAGIVLAWFVVRTFIDGYRAPRFFFRLEPVRHIAFPALILAGLGLYTIATQDWIGLGAMLLGAAVFVAAALSIYGLGFICGRFAGVKIVNHLER